MTLYTHESVYTQCFPVRVALRKTGASLSIEMVFEKLNMSQVELIHPSQTEWMSPISLSDKIRMEIQ